MNLSFAHPGLLALLVAPLWLVIWTWRRSGRELVLPWDHASSPTSRGWFWLLKLAECLPALLLAVVIVLLAGPLALSQPRLKRKLSNIEFCVDVSYSMTAQFGSGTRYDASMQAIDEFLEARAGDAFGLTFFGNSVLHWVPLTTDVSAIRCAPPFMQPERVPDWFGGTEIGKALMACRDVLVGREEGDRMIVLVTDGYSADLYGGNEQTVAKALREESIVLYAIHVADSQVPDEVVDMAAATGGEVFSAGDPQGLRVVFERIDQMQPTRMEHTPGQRVDDFFPWCVAGLSLAVASGGALLGLRYTPW